MADIILIVEDEPKLADSLSKYLEGSGYKTHIVDNGNDVVDWVKTHKPSLVLLDLMLPGKDGITICQELRQFTKIPIIITTSKSKEIDRLIGLEIGADDYVCKPYSLRELVARTKALLRRVDFNNSFGDEEQKLKLNKSTYTISFESQTTSLTPVEFNILQALFLQPGNIFHREVLMRYAYEDSRIVSYRTLDTHVKNIRGKLTLIAPDVKFLHSIYGVGYKLEL